MQRNDLGCAGQFDCQLSHSSAPAVSPTPQRLSLSFSYTRQVNNQPLLSSPTQELLLLSSVVQQVHTSTSLCSFECFAFSSRVVHTSTQPSPRHTHHSTHTKSNTQTLSNHTTKNNKNNKNNGFCTSHVLHCLHGPHWSHSGGQHQDSPTCICWLNSACLTAWYQAT